MPSISFLESAYGPETDVVWLVLATISHDSLSEDIRIVNDLEDITSNGNLYLACPFEITLPNDTDLGPPVAQVQIDDVSLELKKSLRELATPPAFHIAVVSSDDPDTIEAEYAGLTLQGVKASEGVVRGTIGLDDLRLEAFPAHNFSPTYFQGLF